MSFAVHWIKAEIHEYILKNWRMVKVATTKAQRKLFFNLRSMKHQLKAEQAEGQTHRNTLSEAEVAHVARELNVKREEVLEMEPRLSGGDVALEPQTDDDGETYAPIAYLADDTQEPTRVIESRRRDALSTDGMNGDDVRVIQFACRTHLAFKPVDHRLVLQGGEGIGGLLGRRRLAADGMQQQMAFLAVALQLGQELVDLLVGQGVLVALELGADRRQPGRLGRLGERERG